MVLSDRGMVRGTCDQIVTASASPRMPSDGTIGGLVGKLIVLRVECPTCGRHGRYHVARQDFNRADFPYSASYLAFVPSAPRAGR
jgi:hypothetical protein